MFYSNRIVLSVCDVEMKRQTERTDYYNRKTKNVLETYLKKYTRNTHFNFDKIIIIYFFYIIRTLISLKSKRFNMSDRTRFYGSKFVKVSKSHVIRRYNIIEYTHVKCGGHP